MRQLLARRKDLLLLFAFAATAVMGAWLGLVLVPPATGAPNEALEVPRTGAVLTGSEVEDLIFGALAERGYAGELMVKVPDLPESWAYEGAETGFRLTSPTMDARVGPVSFYLEFLVGATAHRIVTLTAWVRVYRKQVVSARPLTRGQSLSESDLKLMRVEVKNVDDPGFESVAEAVGLRARRTLPAGWTLASRDLERVPAVLRGQRVPVRYTVGSITVRATVEVKADGWVGDSIPVQNVDSRRGFSARVVGPGVLEVEGGR